MKVYIFLISSAVVMAFATGYFALSLGNIPYAPSFSNISEFRNILSDFQKENAPKAIIHFSSIFTSMNKFQLVDPLYNLKKEDANIANIFSTDKECFKHVFSSTQEFIAYDLFSDNNYQKATEWEKFSLRKNKSVKKRFFSNNTIHPSLRKKLYISCHQKQISNI